MSAMLFVLIFPRAQRVHSTIPLNEMYGYSRLCDRLRSSAIVWKQLSLRSSAICDPRSFAIIWNPALNLHIRATKIEDPTQTHNNRISWGSIFIIDNYFGTWHYEKYCSQLRPMASARCNISHNAMVVGLA